MHHPILRLGLAGFSRETQARVQALIADETGGGPHWQLAPAKHADVLWVNSQAIRLDTPTVLIVSPETAAEAPLVLKLSDVDRPLAFSVPLPDTSFEPLYTFDPLSDASMRGMLQQFEGWLRPLRARFELAAQLIEREATLRVGVYHLMRRGTLLGVLDLQRWLLGLSPVVRPLDLADEEALWLHRPPAANDVPRRFVRVSLTHLLWDWAQRSIDPPVPPALRNACLFFRHAPAVPPQWVDAACWGLLKELCDRPDTLAGLAGRLPLARPALARMICALHYAGSLTLDPKEAAAPGADPQRRRAKPPQWGASGPPPGGPLDLGAPPGAV